MEDKTERHIYEMNAQPGEATVSVEIAEVAIEGTPLVECDTSKKYLLHAGRAVLQVSLAFKPEINFIGETLPEPNDYKPFAKFRDFTMKPDSPRVDDTYLEQNPFEKPIRRTQIPIYPEDIERLRPEERDNDDYPKFITSGKMSEVIQHLPDKEEVLKMIHDKCHEVIDWTQKRIGDSYEKGRKLFNGEERQDDGRPNE